MVFDHSKEKKKSGNGFCVRSWFICSQYIDQTNEMEEKEMDSTKTKLLQN
jgi:hypothetical protein